MINTSNSPHSWKIRYIQLLESEMGSGACEREAFDLRAANAPRSLYRYRKLNEHTVQELREGYFWITPPDDFNDPFDSALLIQHDLILAEMAKKSVGQFLGLPETASLLTAEEKAFVHSLDDPLPYLLEIINRGTGRIVSGDRFIKQLNVNLEPMWQAQSKRIANYLKICCFCENYTSTVMWGHYAEGHSGICIEYNTQELLADDDIRPYLHPVIYATKRFDSTGDYSPRKTASRKFAALLPACHKSPDWSYEEEWRLVIPIGPQDRKYRCSRFKPKRLLIGAKMTDEKRREIEAIADKLALPVSIGQLSRTDFSITF